jgi:hypothetical protein
MMSTMTEVVLEDEGEMTHDCIDSDQGTHVTGQVVKEVSRILQDIRA